MVRTAQARWEDRQRGLEALRDQQLDQQVRDALQDVWESGRQPERIRLRETFSYRSGTDAPAPPASRLVTSRGLQLRLYLTAVFVAQCEAAAGKRAPADRPLLSTPARVGWSDLVATTASQSTGMGRRWAATSSDNRVRQLKGALRGLEREQMVELGPPGARDRFTGFRLMAETGRGTLATPKYYVVPDDSETCPSVPAWVFLDGWIHVLTDSQVAAYLMLQHLRWTFPGRHQEDGVYVAGDDRDEHYDLNKDAYESHQLLAAAGVLRRIADPRRGENGKAVLPSEDGEPLQLHRFVLDDTRPDRLAIDLVLAVLESGSYWPVSLISP